MHLYTECRVAPVVGVSLLYALTSLLSLAVSSSDGNSYAHSGLGELRQLTSLSLRAPSPICAHTLNITLEDNLSCLQELQELTIASSAPHNNFDSNASPTIGSFAGLLPWHLHQ